jgi:hypothetical protein
VDLSDGVRAKVGILRNIEACILHHSLALVEINVHPAIAGFEQEIASDQIFSLGETDRNKRLISCTVVALLL